MYRYIGREPGTAFVCKDVEWFKGCVKIVLCKNKQSLKLFKSALEELGKAHVGAKLVVLRWNLDSDNQRAGPHPTTAPTLHPALSHNELACGEGRSDFFLTLNEAKAYFFALEEMTHFYHISNSYPTMSHHIHLTILKQWKILKRIYSSLQ